MKKKAVKKFRVDLRAGLKQKQNFYMSHCYKEVGHSQKQKFYMSQ